MKLIKSYLFLFGFLFSNLQSWSFHTMHANKSYHKIESHPYVLDRSKLDTIILINSQSRFDSIHTSIRTALRKGYRNVVVDITQGVYYFKENHLRLEHLNFPDAHISLVGINAKLIASGSSFYGISNDYPKETVNCTLLDEHFNSVNLWSPLVFSKDTIELIDKNKQICRLKIPKDFFSTNILEKASKIKITQWYTSCDYDIIKIDSGYVHFYVYDLAYNKNLRKYNVNYDYAYGKKPIRFALYTPSLAYRLVPPNYIVHSCECSCYLLLKDCNISSFLMKNLEFCGNSRTSDLLEFYNNEMDKCSVEDCTFSNISSTLSYVIKTNNFCFLNNLVRNCYGRGITITNDCSNTIVRGNFFDNCGRSLIQNSCVHCAGSDYLICDNIFRNFSYAAISVGVWHGTKKDQLSSGIVEYNDIFYNLEYLSNYPQYTLMDGGAIYSCTQNDNVIIRNNYIHDYAGMFDNRGVFCDDGTCNITICENVIENIANSYCIDLRLCPTIIDVMPNANTGNYIGKNILYGPVRFQGKESDIFCNRYIQNQKYPNDIITNVHLNRCKIKKNRVSLIRSIKKHIAKNNKWGRKY